MTCICSLCFLLCLAVTIKSESPYIDLNNGYKMPVVGYGTFDAGGEELDTALDAALEAGYRHIDTATVNENEEAIGRVLKRWMDSGKLTRADLFLVTKLPGAGMRPEHVQKFLKESLARLQVDYLDLYLINSPVGLKYVENELFPTSPEGELELDLTTNITAVWKTMEEQVDLGLAKSIGLSNFNNSQVERILNVARIKPVTNQIEIHLYYQQKDVVKFNKEHDIVTTAYAPLGAPGLVFTGPGASRNNDLGDPAVLELATKYNKSPAQILLRHGVQKGLVVIPKSKTPSRIQQNFAIFDFELTDKEMTLFNGLDKGKEGRNRFDGELEFLKHPEGNL